MIYPTMLLDYILLIRASILRILLSFFLFEYMDQFELSFGLLTGFEASYNFSSFFLYDYPWSFFSA